MIGVKRAQAACFLARLYWVYPYKN